MNRNQEGYRNQGGNRNQDGYRNQEGNRNQDGFQRNPAIAGRPKTEPEFLKPDSDYIAKAEDIIKAIDTSKITTSKIRNVLSMVNTIYNEVIIDGSETLSVKNTEEIQYLKIRMVYEAGRDDTRERVLRNFFEKSGIISALDYIGNSKTKFVRYTRYLEALTAYHRFYGGRDN